MRRHAAYVDGGVSGNDARASIESCCNRSGKNASSIDLCVSYRQNVRRQEIGGSFRLFGRRYGGDSTSITIRFGTCWSETPLMRGGEGVFGEL